MTDPVRVIDGTSVRTTVSVAGRPGTGRDRRSGVSDEQTEDSADRTDDGHTHAREPEGGREESGFYGFWTYDPVTVDWILDHLRETYGLVEPP
jgi:hypothetical protein